MQILPKDEALRLLESFGSVDEGIKPALVTFICIAHTLGLETYSSCGGHIDWKYPFPSIDFRVPFQEIVIPPLWKVWRGRERKKILQQAKQIRSTSKNRLTSAMAFLTDEVVEFYSLRHHVPQIMFRVHRTGELRFSVMPAFSDYSRMLRQKGDYRELELLLALQRKHLALLADHLLNKLSSSNFSLVGANRSNCLGCRAAS